MKIEDDKRQYILQRWSTRMQLNYHIVDNYFKAFTYKELCRTFIIEEKKKISYRRLSIKYKMTIGEVRHICDNYEIEKEMN